MSVENLWREREIVDAKPGVAVQVLVDIYRAFKGVK